MADIKKKKSGSKVSDKNKDISDTKEKVPRKRKEKEVSSAEIDENKITEQNEDVVIFLSEEEKQKSENEANLPNKNKFYYGYNLRFAFNLFLLVILMFAFVTSILTHFSTNGRLIVKYNEKSDIDYKVYLKNNDFYETPYLDKGMAYVASLIDKIDINYIYNFDVSEQTDLEVKYKIIGKLVIKSQSNSNIFYEKEYDLTDEVVEQIQGKKNFSLNKNILIDYSYYNNLANRFRSSYAVHTNSYLEVYLKVDEANSDERFTITNSSKTSLTIPLSEQEINISLDNKKLNEEKQVEAKAGVQDYRYLAISIALFVLAVVEAVRLYNKLLLTTTRVSAYDKYISKLLRGYDRIIVNVKTAPNLDAYNVIKVESFDELVDVRDNTNEPIKYYVVTEHVKSEFFVTNREDLYLYIVKSVDIDNK